MTKEYVIKSKVYGNQSVLLDDKDYQDLIDNNIKLHLKNDKTIKGFYVQFHYPDKTKKEGRGTIGLHRYIMKCPKGFQVDHINRNPLDNRKSNLRIVTSQENSHNKGEYKNNKSGHKGIYYINCWERWIGEFKYNKKCYRTKRFKTMNEAIIARKELLKELALKGVM